LLGTDPLCAAVSVRSDGFHLDLPTDVKAKSVTAVEYYCWRQRLCENGTAATANLQFNQNSLRS